MTWKFSTPRSIKTAAHRSRKALWLFLIVTTGTDAASAQSPATPTKPKVAYVRFWNMLPAKAKGNALELFEADNKMLTVAGPGNCFADYLPVVPGSYTFSVCRPESVATPLKRLPINLPADTFITIVVSEKDGQPVVEGLNDTIDPKAAGDAGRLVVRQYLAGSQATVSVGTAPATALLSYGAVTVLDNLPAAQVNVNVRATSPNGTAQNWTVPADFTTDHHGTLLILTDAYGQFRPRFAVDGHAAGPPGRH